MYSPAARHLRIPMPPLRQQKLPTREILWRQAWPDAFTLILSSIMLVLTVIIIALEVASLTVDRFNQLSNTVSTGAGIWCSIGLVTAIVFMYFLGSLPSLLRSANSLFVFLVLAFDNSRRWSTYTLVVHMISLFFILILIGLDANTVTPYNNLISSAPTKIQLLKGQLAIAILSTLCPLSFLAAYIYTAFHSLHPHLPPVHSPYPVMKYWLLLSIKFKTTTRTTFDAVRESFSDAHWCQ